MLEGVFAPGGTASEVSIPGYELAGKTGTANKIDPTTGEYSESAYVASFVGFAPAPTTRELLIAVMVDEPQGAIYGGKVAAPAFRQDRVVRAARTCGSRRGDEHVRTDPRRRLTPRCSCARSWATPRAAPRRSR